MLTAMNEINRTTENFLYNKCLSINEVPYKKLIGCNKIVELNILVSFYTN